MNNEGYSWKSIKEKILQKGYDGSDSLLRTYLAKIKKENIKEKKHKTYCRTNDAYIIAI